MPRKPAAEFEIDADLVRRLLVQAPDPDVRGAALEKAAEGWDCDVWRCGDDLAVRLPRRAVAAPLIAHEALALPRFADAVAATGVALPVPLFTGEPAHGYPWRWSIVPWIAGSSGLDVPRTGRRGWAEPLAAALGALHAPASADHPVNPFRGVPLRERDAGVTARLENLRASGSVSPTTFAQVRDAWTQGLSAPAWSGPPLWIHGDLHPGNIVADGPRLRGIVDFGDVTGGDPAYDLAIAWLAFDRAGRDAFIAATRSRYDDATWVRARAWAAAVGTLLAAHSDDAPAYGILAAEALQELASD